LQYASRKVVEMTFKHVLLLTALVVGLIISMGGARPQQASAAPNIFASPVQAGCYLARPDRCKIHVDPFTITVASGKKLVYFSLVAIQGGTQTMIYNFHTDQSNPVPFVGSTFTPSMVAKDFGATCGKSYTVNLQGQDSGDVGPLSLGLTAQFTCPTGTYRQLLPVAQKP
jgi:hypothetical protein